MTTTPPRLLVIGAGARGNAYAQAVASSTVGVIASVAEPVTSKREALGRKYIWPTGERQDDQEFESWQDFMRYETSRQERTKVGEKGGVLPGLDGVFVCTLDETHVEIITALAPLGLHIMSEKPLATTLSDCLKIYRALKPAEGEAPTRVFSVGHVLRYSPHNILLRKLLLEDGVIGDLVSIEHTEPVGWWHFSHSYVRGNWRKESTTAPSLLTKSCHDIDFMLWLFCSSTEPNEPASMNHPHLPSYVSSTGSLSYFKKGRKPILAGNATNCVSCPVEMECMYSAKKIYVEKHLARGIASWPVNVVDSEIEDILKTQGKVKAQSRLVSRLEENYDKSTPQHSIDGRPWFGRCVYESDNDVCDDQVVTMTWEEAATADATDGYTLVKNRGAKTASFHMTAFTEKQCERRGRIYGTQGEIEYDSKMIRVFDFATSERKVYHPDQPGGGHGGGDAGLAKSFVEAINAVKNEHVGVSQAQRAHIGCTLEDVIRSHAMVFAAEEARRGKKVVDWKEWWALNVDQAV